MVFTLTALWNRSRHLNGQAGCSAAHRQDGIACAPWQGGGGLAPAACVPPVQVCGASSTNLSPIIQSPSVFSTAAHHLSDLVPANVLKVPHLPLALLAVMLQQRDVHTRLDMKAGSDVGHGNLLHRWWPAALSCTARAYAAGSRCSCYVPGHISSYSLLCLMSY